MGYTIPEVPGYPAPPLQPGLKDAHYLTAEIARMDSEFQCCSLHDGCRLEEVVEREETPS